MAHPVSRVIKASRVNGASEASREFKGSKAHRDFPVSQVCQVLLGLPVHLASKESKVSKDFQVDLDLQELMDCLVLLEKLEQRANLGLKERQALKAYKERLALQVSVAMTDYLDLLGHLDPREKKESKDSPGS